MASIYERLSPDNISNNPARAEIKKLVNRYADVTESVLKETQRLRGMENKSDMINRLKSLRSDAEKKLKALADSTERFAEIAPAKSHLKGQALANKYIKEQSKYVDVDGNTVQVLEMKPKDEQEIKKIVDNVRSDSLREAKMITGDWVDRFDETIRKGITDLQGGTTREVRDQIADRIRDNGLSLVDSAGRTWKPDSYAKMYARTRTREYQTAGIENRMNDYDLDLVKISQHVDVDGMDICNRFEANVYSLSGDHPEYPELTVRTPFHPNCAHVETPWVEKYQNPEKFDKPKKKPKEPGDFENAQEASDWLDRKYDIDSDFTYKPKNVDYPTVLDNRGFNVIKLEKNQDRFEEIINKDFDLDIDLINENMKKFDELAQKYPKVADNLNYIGTYHGDKAPNRLFNYDWDPSTFAHASADGKRIGINPLAYHDYDYMKNEAMENVAKGWHPQGTNTVTSTLSHEFGHHVNYNYSSYFTSRYDNIDVGDLKNKYLTKYRNSDIDKSNVLDAVDDFSQRAYDDLADADLSRYALENEREAFAEGFSAIQEGSKAEHDYLKYQKRILDKIENNNLYDKSDTIDIKEAGQGLPPDQIEEAADLYSEARNNWREALAEYFIGY